MKYAVVIPAFQAAATLAPVIAAWRTMAPASEAILVIDDGSTDGTTEVAKREGATVVRMAVNSGRGAARARGVQETDAPFILMCDTALTPAPDFMSQAIPWFADSKVGAVFAYVVQQEPKTFVERWRGRHLFKSAPPVQNRRALLATSICILRREAVEQVGGFDAALRAGEDADLGRRLLAAGWDVVTDPTLWALSHTRDSAHGLLGRYARVEFSARSVGSRVAAPICLRGENDGP
ncbi:glycosyl transferase family 2 [Chthoniobacter flavus Ellin428]|uniref:Glycosyl transferase family 2 n=1 Tax=Chthoniobacter flavus Ellin428 TaxID=497964 RepID=B4D1J8_9BACT|nr:glycosyltransferase [Chthoniobacter flavus]EDY19610.1 glycosyl transferase family 2 [Chthoniobacter flavus Ellin428]